MQEAGEGLGYQIEYSQSRLLVIPRVHLQLPCGSRRQPDISGWKKPVKLDNQASLISHRPDWVCEILSRETKQQDSPGGDKFIDYETSCIPFYWIVDSLKGDISVYELIVDEYAKTQQVSLENDNRSVLPPFNGEFDVKQIFKYS
ncbi:TPA: hypothetical protein ACH3X2_005046 [Trebouxia sp. C0005]